MDYLYHASDEKHPVSAQDILKHWKSKGIEASRKSVYHDIELLMQLGIDVVCVKSTQNLYFIGSRLFELPELKLLVDAVESSRFITPKKSEELISKLGMKSLSKGVKVDVLEGVVTVSLSLNLKYGYSIKDITTKVQEKVKAAIENMTGLEVADVNIRVAGVDVPEED